MLEADHVGALKVIDADVLVVRVEQEARALRVGANEPGEIDEAH